MSTMIQACNIEKIYRIGTSTGSYATLRDSIAEYAKASFRRIHNRLSGSGLRPPRAGQQGYLRALESVSFSVAAGEAVGIIGHNGAGKSTLLKILSRVTEPSSGRVLLRGRVGSLLEVGTGFHHELTGRENIYLNRAILGMKRREVAKQFDKIVDFAEIEPFLDTPVKRYSSGMFVRLGFAVAAHMEPDVLLVDEVLAVGDLRFQRKCMEFARTLSQRHAALLLVSHNMFSVKSLCHRAIYLSHGQIRFDGLVEDAIEMYEKDSRLRLIPWAEGQLGTDPTHLPITIETIESLDENGERRTVFKHGQRMRVRISYRLRKASLSPNFIVAFMRSDGIGCCNFNTTMDGFGVSRVTGEGIIELVTPPLKLVSEVYSIHVLVKDESFQRLYCAQIGPSFHISDDLLSTHFGIFHERGEWTTIR